MPFFPQFSLLPRFFTLPLPLFLPLFSPFYVIFFFSLPLLSFFSFFSGFILPHFHPQKQSLCSRLKDTIITVFTSSFFIIYTTHPPLFFLHYLFHSLSLLSIIYFALPSFSSSITHFTKYPLSPSPSLPPPFIFLLLSSSAFYAVKDREVSIAITGVLKSLLALSSLAFYHLRVYLYDLPPSCFPPSLLRYQSKQCLPQPIFSLLPISSFTLLYALLPSPYKVIENGEIREQNNSLGQCAPTTGPPFDFAWPAST